MLHKKTELDVESRALGAVIRARTGRSGCPSCSRATRSSKRSSGGNAALLSYPRRATERQAGTSVTGRFVLVHYARRSDRPKQPWIDRLRCVGPTRAELRPARPRSPSVNPRTSRVPVPRLSGPLGQALPLARPEPPRDAIGAPAGFRDPAIPRSRNEVPPDADRRDAESYLDRRGMQGGVPADSHHLGRSRPRRSAGTRPSRPAPGHLTRARDRWKTGRSRGSSDPTGRRRRCSPS